MYALMVDEDYGNWTFAGIYTSVKKLEKAWKKFKFKNKHPKAEDYIIVKCKINQLIEFMWDHKYE